MARPLTNNEVYAKVKGFEHKYGFCKKEDVLSAVALLKERLKRIGYKDAYKSTGEIIDSCFQIQEEVQS